MKSMKELRLERGMTQKQLSEECDVWLSQISKFENGHSVPDLGTAVRIANALRVSVHGLADRMGWT